MSWGHEAESGISNGRSSSVEEAFEVGPIIRLRTRCVCLASPLSHINGQLTTLLTRGSQSSAKDNVWTKLSAVPEFWLPHIEPSPTYPSYIHTMGL